MDTKVDPSGLEDDVAVLVPEFVIFTNNIGELVFLRKP